MTDVSTPVDAESFLDTPLKQMCACCFRDELHLLKHPQKLEATEEFGDVRFKHRKYMIPKSCPRCDRKAIGCLAWLSCCHEYRVCRREWVTADIYLPINVVADTRIMDRKHAASVAVNAKPANKFLQMISLFAMAEDPLVRDAYCTVGLASVLDEISFIKGNISIRTYLVERYPWMDNFVNVPDTEVFNTGTRWCTASIEQVSLRSVMYSLPPQRAVKGQETDDKADESSAAAKEEPEGSAKPFVKIAFTKAVLSAGEAYALKRSMPFYAGHEHDPKRLGDVIRHAHPCDGCQVTIFDHSHAIKSEAESQKYPQLCRACTSSALIRSQAEAAKAKTEALASKAAKASDPAPAPVESAQASAPAEAPAPTPEPEAVVKPPVASSSTTSTPEFALPAQPASLSHAHADVRQCQRDVLLATTLMKQLKENPKEANSRVNFTAEKLSTLGFIPEVEVAVLRALGKAAHTDAARNLTTKRKALMHAQAQLENWKHAQLKPSPIEVAAMAVAAVKTTGCDIADLAAGLPGPDSTKDTPIAEPKAPSTPPVSGKGPAPLSVSAGSQPAAVVTDKAGLSMAASNLAAVEKDVEIDRLQRGFTDGEVVHSHIVHVTPNPEHAECKVKGLRAPGEEQTGVRTASSRSPQLTAEKVNLHSQDERNLHAANTLRNVNIGLHEPSDAERARLQHLKEILKTKLFTRVNCNNVLKEYTDIRDTCMPSKLSGKDKESWMANALNEAEGSSLSYVRALTYSRTIEAFVKSEVTSADKPRPIANHKEIRLVALCKVAWVFDHVMFQHLELMSIKHRGKRSVIEEMADFMSTSFDGTDGKGKTIRPDTSKTARYVENDFSAFEFGIGQVLKEFEADILLHIAKQIGYSAADLEVSGLLFKRVLDDRTRACEWKMTCKDATGAVFTYRFLQKRPMRESGDRLTSSGNFLQNLIAWTVYLVSSEGLEAAVMSMLKHRGKKFLYESARDGAIYVACLYFEGDDTIGRLEEDAVWAASKRTAQFMVNGVFETKTTTMLNVEWFFKRWGFRSKCDFKKTEGYDYYRFVGYDTLIKDNKPVTQGAGTNRRLVMQPDLKRILTTKAWTTQVGTPAQIRFATGVYATSYGSEFAHNDVAHAYFKAMWEASTLTESGKREVLKKTRDHDMTDLVLRFTGNMALSESQDHVKYWLKNSEFPNSTPSTKEDKILSTLAVGDFTDLEWATGSSSMGFQVHGKDLASNLPKTWYSA